MPRVTYVQKAQARYPTVPTLGPDGEQIVTTIIRKDGTAKTTKHGREVIRRATHEDRTQPPLPNRVCGKCGKEITPGSPYKWIAPKSGPYGGRRLYRCGTCPVWNVWEYSSSLSARLAQISADFSSALDSCTTGEDVSSALEEAAGQVRELAEEKREGAQNIEEGFGHATSQSEELETLADDLESWADEIEGATVPDYPEPEEEDCPACDGTGEMEDTGEAAPEENATCDDCGGTGTVEGDDPTDEQISEWLDQCRDELAVVDEPPV